MDIYEYIVSPFGIGLIVGGSFGFVGIALKYGFQFLADIVRG